MLAMLQQSAMGTLSKSQPLFSYITPDGKLLHLTHSVFVKLLKLVLKTCGIDPTNSGHSFRRGGCSHAFSLGVSPLLIKLRGDWKSNAYERYVNIHMDKHVMFANAPGHSVLKP
jgi:integrase